MKNSLSRKAVWITVLTLGFVPLLIQGAEAADYRVTPSIRLGQGWDSNIFGTSSNEVSDFYSTVTPDLAFSAASPNLSMQLRGSVEGRWYYDHPDVSSAGYSKNVRLTSAWKPTARFSMSPAAYYLETLDSTARSFLVPVDPTVPPLGIANYGLQKSRDFGGSIGLQYQATPLVETAGTVYGAAHQLPDQSGNASDSHTLGADASIRYTNQPEHHGGSVRKRQQGIFQGYTRYPGIRGRAPGGSPDLSGLPDRRSGRHVVCPANRFGQ